MSFISSILAPFKWLASKIAAGAKVTVPIAVTITEAIKTILANPVTNFLVNIADVVTGTNIPTDVANSVNAIIPKILAAELAVEGLPSNPTEADILAFEQRVLSAFNLNSDNSRLYTVLGAQIYQIVDTTVQSGNVTFATLVSDVETAYQDYQADLAANASVTTAPSTNVSPESSNESIPIVSPSSVQETIPTMGSTDNAEQTPANTDTNITTGASVPPNL